MFIFLVLIIFFSFCKIYDKDSIKLIKYGLNNIRWIYILICLIVIFGYFLLQGIYMKTILAALKYKITLTITILIIIVLLIYIILSVLENIIFLNIIFKLEKKNNII